MSTQTKYPERIEALVPGGGKGIDLPDEIADWWEDLPVHRESPSSILAFLDCPTKWFTERHLEKAYAATGKTVLGITNFARQPANQWSVGGTLVHRALEVFYSEPPANRNADLLEEIYDFAWDMLAKGDWTDGIVTKSMVTEYDAMIANLPSKDLPLKSFKSRFRHTYREIALQTLEMERPKSVRVVGNEAFINMTRGRMTILGKIDREDATLKGEVKIVDYKTGRSPAGEISVFNKTFIPAGIYALARTEEMSATPSARPVVGVQLMYLKELRNCSIRTDEKTLQDVSDIVDMVGEQMDRIGETGVLPTGPAATQGDAPCRFCPLQDRCPDWA